MDSNSSLFDRIRVKPAPPSRGPDRVDDAVQPSGLPGAKACFARRRDGSGKASISLLQGPCARIQRHLRLFQAEWTTTSLAKFRKEDAIGHRPTWKLGARAAASHVDETVFAEARAARRRGVQGQRRSRTPRHPIMRLALKALMTLELDGSATATKIKSRYKDLVKRHHPDANGGDRSSEDKLREIIQAYNYLRANKLV